MTDIFRCAFMVGMMLGGFVGFGVGSLFVVWLFDDEVKKEVDLDEMLRG